MPQDYSESLIFLYSAMMRIAELPLTEKFLLIDPDNACPTKHPRIYYSEEPLPSSENLQDIHHFTVAFIRTLHGHSICTLILIICACAQWENNRGC